MCSALWFPRISARQSRHRCAYGLFANSDPVGHVVYGLVRSGRNKCTTATVHITPCVLLCAPTKRTCTPPLTWLAILSTSFELCLSPSCGQDFNAPICGWGYPISRERGRVLLAHFSDAYFTLPNYISCPTHRCTHPRMPPYSRD